MAKQTRKTQAQKNAERAAKLEQELRIIRKRFGKAFAAVEAARRAVYELNEDAYEMGFGDFSANYGALVDLKSRMESELDEVETYARKARG